MSYETEQAKIAAKEYSKCRYHDDHVSVKKHDNNKKISDAYYAETGSFDLNTYSQICEMCGCTFETKDENEDDCQQCRN